MAPNLLYPSAFLKPWSAQRVLGNWSITQNDYNALANQVKSLAKAADPITQIAEIIALQKFVFNANYDARLQSFGFYNTNQGLGVDLFKTLSSQTFTIPSQTFIPKEATINSPDANIYISGLTDISDYKSEGRTVYITSPFSIAKGVSNIANKGDREPEKGGYMIAYTPEAGYLPVIHGNYNGGNERENKISTDIFYPIAFNDSPKSIQTGIHDDVVLYDGSVKSIILSDGDDLAAPSLAAYQPSILYGKNIQSYILNDKTVISSSRGVTVASRPFENGTSDYKLNTATPQDKIDATLNLVTREGTSGTYGNLPYAKKADIKDAEQQQSKIIIGGQKIVGGKGNDILYGYDPLLYANSKATEKASSNNITGSLDLKFLNNPKTSINWKPILLSGGKGNDIFNIGDIGKIKLQSTGSITPNENGNTFYTILGDKDSLSEVSTQARLEESWGATMNSDEINLTAHYDYEEELIQKGVNIENASNDADWYSLGLKGRGTYNTIAKALRGPLFLAFPQVDSLISLAGLASDFTKAIKADQSVQEKFYREELKQKVVPPGNWSQTISLPNWDPLDIIKIATIPVEDPNVIQDSAWANINFSLREENNQIMRPQTFGYTIEIQTAVGNKQSIAYLPGLQSPNLSAQYGCKTYDFFAGREAFIDPLKDITYLGILSNTSKLNRVSYTESEYNLKIADDASLFLWNSQGLSDLGLLNQYRSAASSIQIGVDSRKFAWFTDLQLQKSSTSELDLSASTFNHWDKNQNKWVAISLEKLRVIKPDTLAAQNAAKARFTYWTAQDSVANKLMNLSAADAANSNDVEFYKTRDDGSVLDPVTGEWLAPSNSGYEQAALSEANYAGALSVQETEDGSTKIIVDEGYNWHPSLKPRLPTGEWITFLLSTMFTPMILSTRGIRWCKSTTQA